MISESLSNRLADAGNPVLHPADLTLEILRSRKGRGEEAPAEHRDAGCRGLRPCGPRGAGSGARLRPGPRPGAAGGGAGPLGAARLHPAAALRGKARPRGRRGKENTTHTHTPPQPKPNPKQTKPHHPKERLTGGGVWGVWAGRMRVPGGETSPSPGRSGASLPPSFPPFLHPFSCCPLSNERLVGNCRRSGSMAARGAPRDPAAASTRPGNRHRTFTPCSKAKVSPSWRKLPHPRDLQDGRLDQPLCKQLFF